VFWLRDPEPPRAGSDGFARDVSWLRFIHRAVAGHGTVNAALAARWPPLGDAWTANEQGNAVLARITEADETAVRAAADRVEEVLAELRRRARDLDGAPPIPEVGAVVTEEAIRRVVATEPALVRWVKRSPSAKYTPPTAAGMAYARMQARIGEILTSLGPDAPRDPPTCGEEEVEAVKRSLDLLERSFPTEVAAARRTLDPSVNEEQRARAAASRARDAARPPLTQERIRSLLDFIAAQPLPKKLRTACWLRAPSVASVRRQLGATVEKALAKRGDDPDAFARDLYWLCFIRSFTRAGSIDDAIVRAQELAQTPAPFWRASRRRRFVDGLAQSTEVLRSIWPDEEAAVATMLDDIDRVFQAAQLDVPR
jgi:hypothetical protein